MAKLPYTNSKTAELLNLNDWGKVFVGIDGYLENMSKQLADVHKNIPTYPPVNIKKLGECKYVIEMALAGYGKSDIELEMEGDKLHIRGKTQEDEDKDYIFKGIAQRAFTRTFSVVDHLEVKNATMINGMLKVTLEGMSQMSKKLIPID